MIGETCPWGLTLTTSLFGVGAVFVGIIVGFLLGARRP